MSFGKRFDEWDRASLIACLIHNDPEGRRRRLYPDTFLPGPFKTGYRPKPQTIGTISDPRQVASIMGGTFEIVK